MNKATFVFLLLSSVSVAAVANNETGKGPGDPKKGKEKKSSFGLSSGYFSLFTIFTPEPAVPDTTLHIPSQVQPRKEDAEN